MFQEDNDDSTCALCDISRYVFNELTEPQNYIDSIDDVNKKSGLFLFFLFASISIRIELCQIADSCSTHLHALQGSSPLNSSEDSIEADGVE
jgi:hypothetical protein